MGGGGDFQMYLKTFPLKVTSTALHRHGEVLNMEGGSGVGGDFRMYLKTISLKMTSMALHRHREVLNIEGAGEGQGSEYWGKGGVPNF